MRRDPMIARITGVCSGRPVIANTRFPTETVVGWDFDVEAMRAAYPHLARAQIEAAIAFERRWPRRLGRWIEQRRARLGRWLLREDDA